MRQQGQCQCEPTRGATADAPFGKGRNAAWECIENSIEDRIFEIAVPRVARRAGVAKVRLVADAAAELEPTVVTDQRSSTFPALVLSFVVRTLRARNCFAEMKMRFPAQTKQQPVDTYEFVNIYDHVQCQPALLAVFRIELCGETR